ncbi:Uncharacterised protein [Clostridium tertium]|uniref:Uncharacterized protein n=1 Tax=Clostridium tertium TaxID=1559 RepID=A0A6N3E3K0_9CLOT
MKLKQRLINQKIHKLIFNITQSSVLGSDFCLGMYWLRLGLSFLICILSAINLFNSNKLKYKDKYK